MYLRILVYLEKGLFKFSLGNRFGQFYYLALDPDHLHPLSGSPLIGKIIWPCPNPYDCQAGKDSSVFQPACLACQVFLHGLGHVSAFHQYAHIRFLLSTGYGQGRPDR